jgi:hypothetical protein
MYQQ